MRQFYFFRKEDESGVSGTGFVAEGVVFENGKCVVAWLTEHTSVCVYDHIETVEKIHGHGGKTLLAWEDHDWINEEGKLILNADTGCVDAATGGWLGTFEDTTKPFNGKDKVRIGEFLRKRREQSDWLKLQDWDDPEQFHGEDGDGYCALCHDGSGGTCAYCKKEGSEVVTNSVGYNL